MGFVVYLELKIETKRVLSAIKNRNRDIRKPILPDSTG